MQQTFSKIKPFLRQFITRLLVRFKRVKRSPVDIQDINSLVNKPLPEMFELETPGGVGELTILGVELSIAPSTINFSSSASADFAKTTNLSSVDIIKANSDCIHAEVLCNFSVKVKESLIYNTHLMLIIETLPNYCKESKTIGIKQTKISQLQLISDKYSLIKDTTTLLNGLIPKPLNSIVNIALSSTKEKAKELGYVETLFGRRLYLPQINASNGMLRQAAERTAINAPMQGSAADIIKIAMLQVQKWLGEEKPDCFMVMQVHDELVFEVAEDKLDEYSEKINQLMVSAVELSVPLVVDVGVGDNWEQAH